MDAIKELNVTQVEVVRLSRDQYQKLVHSLGGMAVPFSGNQTTEQQAGFMLGIQYVLQKLRDGFVIEA